MTGLKLGFILIFSFIATSSVGLTGCIKTQFGSKEPSARPKTGELTDKDKTVLSPPELDPSRRELVCAESYRAARIAFVVDNSKSNGLPSGEVQTGQGGRYLGTDPVRQGRSPHGPNERFTDRQSAIYEMVLRTASLDRQATEKNPKFLGSEIGVAYFPAGDDYAELAQFRTVSGDQNPSLPKLMTNMKDMNYDEPLKDLLWSSLNFTHQPDGATPYLTALTSAKHLLTTGKNPNDPRKDVIFLITDGLPTDERPSRVVSFRAEMPDVKLVLLSIYQAGNDLTTQNAPAKASLQAAWDSTAQGMMWGRKPGNNDGFATFEAYWSRLLQLPQDISDNIIEVNGSDNIRPALDTVLEVVQTCH